MQEKKPVKVNRYQLLDFLRGIAIILMVIFHFSFDLTMFGYLSIDFQNETFWYVFPRFIVFLFLICVGMGLPLTHKKSINWDKVKKRFVKIGGMALIITILTRIAFGPRFIFFGTLHCIAVCSVLGLPFIKRPRLSLILGLIIFIPSAIHPITFIEWSEIFGGKSLDYIPVYPWFGIVLVGIFLNSIKVHQLEISQNPLFKGIIYLGQHSLFIYLIHQIILYGAVYLYYTITNMS